MSSNIEATANTTETTEGTMNTENQNEATTDTTDANGSLDQVRKIGREAAATRGKLREAEAANEAIANQMTEMQRGTIAAHMQAGKSFNPELLELAGYTPDQFFTEAGAFNPEAVKEAINTVSERFGIFTGDKVKYVNLNGDGSASLSGGADWSSALKTGLR